VGYAAKSLYGNKALEFHVPVRLGFIQGYNPFSQQMQHLSGGTYGLCHAKLDAW
jgi:hypothetical protein